jgi:hypothetical protein
MLIFKCAYILGLGKHLFRPVPRVDSMCNKYLVQTGSGITVLVINFSGVIEVCLSRSFLSAVLNTHTELAFPLQWHWL